MHLKDVSVRRNKNYVCTNQVHTKWDYDYKLVRVFVNLWDYSLPATIIFGPECTYSTNKSFPNAYKRFFFSSTQLRTCCMHIQKDFSLRASSCDVSPIHMNWIG